MKWKIRRRGACRFRHVARGSPRSQDTETAARQPVFYDKAFITFSDGVLYTWYAAAPVPVDILDPLEDQRLGGVIMWIPGFLVFLVASGFVFFRWTKDEFKSWGSEG